MKLVLADRKQRELIEKEKILRNSSFLDLAKKLGIAEGKLKAHYYDNILLSEKLFNKFLLSKEFKKYIVEKKENNWGQSNGGKNSNAGYIKEVKCPEKSEELAEFYGIMLGDGNLTKIKAHKIGVYQIRIVGDSRKDREYLLEFVKPLIESLFETKVAISKQKEQNALTLVSTGRKLVEHIESFGFKPGNKIKNQLNIPSWIKEKEDFLKACLRGLYDTDGSVYKLTNQNSHQINFKNYNLTLLKDVRNSLLSFGIGVSNISKGIEINITKKSELRRFLKEIGFSNNKHLDKVKMWNLAP